ncbi:hypothetical protein DFH09DRAFT_473958 [Mycena vulgaris]|nr:hypothetical protein DFH09DRAFT_473958 [Mycena vulgaris]
MSTSSSPPGVSRQTVPGKPIFRLFKSSSQARSNWLATSLLTAKAITAGAECLPFPYVKGIFGMVVTILETVEKVKKNRDDLKELCGNIMDIVRIVKDQVCEHGDTAAVKFKGPCEELDGVLQGVLEAVKQMQTEPRSLSGRLKEVVKLSSTADEIAGSRTKIQELRLNFMLMAAIDTNMQVYKALSMGIAPNVAATPTPQTITKCPPPSRIFHGRNNILDKMYQFFKQDLDEQHIYLLYGLGGAGKTQIALKFIEEFSSHFSDIFLIDTSTAETIDTGLKNIAATRNAGSTAQDGLEWLSSKPAEWLLFFDNADDLKINLNQFFPRCKHGNILITSRNPRLRVYAGSHSLVSDMEEPDAVALLLKSCAQNVTTRNVELATKIVKALYHLPLAIIQAGAFIARSGALSSYLNLYAENQARLLSEQPDQSHDAYARTVDTTWQISFEQLSKPAATILQLCSFLHHKGISEEIFSRASSYHFPSGAPAREELDDPLDFLAQFSGETGVWNSLYFMDVMNEITAYSLANFDPDEEVYSIHPLVHNWSRSMITDQGQYRYWMVAIVGMSISAIPTYDMWSASLKLLSHVDSLLCGNMDISPDFRIDYGRLYFHASRLKDAEQLQMTLLEHQKSVMGEDHINTLHTMGSLACTYHKLGKLQVAEELELVVLEKQRKILGEDHPDTLWTMGSLAATSHVLGKFQEAEGLELGLHEKRRKILGEDHWDTLQTMGNLASIYHDLGKLQEAEELELVVLEKWRRVLGVDHPDTLRTMGSLATTYHNLGKSQEAEELEVVVLDKRRKILGEEHPDTLWTMGNLASTYHDLGKLQEAEELGAVVLEKRKKILGEDHPDTLHTMVNLAFTYHHQGKLKEAEQLKVIVLEKQREVLGEDHLGTLHAMANLAFTYHHQGKLKEAEQLKVMVLEKQRKILGEDDPDTLWTMGSLASTYHDLGKLQEAEDLGLVLLETQKKILGEDHRDTLRTMGNLASTYHNLDKLQEAVELCAAVLEKQKKIFGEDHPDTLWTTSNLASTYHHQGKLKEVEQLYVELLDRQTALLGMDHVDTLHTADSLAQVHQAMNNNNS